MRILVIGPSDTQSCGGMASVIHDIRVSKLLNESFDMDIYPSFIDGNFLKRHLFTFVSFLKFLPKLKYYDVFHIHVSCYHSVTRKGWYLKAIKKANKKAILHIHGSRFKVYYDELNPQKKEEITNLLNMADMVIGLSEEWKEYFENVVHVTNCRSLPNGIDPNIYQKGICDMEKYHHSFVSLGRLGERKGTFDLIEAFESVVKEHKDATLYLAGDGEIEKAKELIQAKHLEKNIEVVGWVNLEGKLDLLSKCATFVLPSYNEGLPMAILESMAAGKLIISSTAGAIPEVIKEENGIIVEAGDIENLTKALLRAYEDIEYLQQASKNNQEKLLKEYSVQRMHQTLKKYFEEV